jgi:hypothetical protein
VAFAAYALTSITPSYVYLGAVCATNDAHPGFDPWTGEPHGRSFIRDCKGNLGEVQAGPIPIVTDTPAELVGRRAVPLPLGFALWIALTLGWLALVRLLRANNAQRSNGLREPVHD